jgi:hypothetical protein
MIFTAIERAFLDQHQIPATRVLNASGLNRIEVQTLMEADDFIVAIGVALCKKSGHRIRMKSWHCAQCSSDNLGFRNNYHRPGSVYVCTSEKSRLIKIGSSSLSLDIRVRKLNAIKYGNSSDWKLVFSYECEKVGVLEFAAHKALRKFRANGEYGGQNRTGECEELFSCTAEEAIEEIMKAANGGDTSKNSNSTNNMASKSTIPSVPRKDIEFRNGERVRNTRAPQWGEGIVIADSTKHAVVISFSDGRQRQFQLPLTALVKI